MGKTFVAVGIIKALKNKGINVCPMKPAESGCRLKQGTLVPGDTMKLIKAAKVHEPLSNINQYRLRSPLAPSVAADIEGITISKNKIFSAFHRLNNNYAITMVEGAGGIMSPLCKKYLFINLVQDLALPLIIVSRSGLGTINHTLLTIETAENRGLDILGVVINNSKKRSSDPSEKSNPELIENLGNVPVLGIVPYISKSSSDTGEIFHRIAGRILLRL